jgi:hypothetical protein
MRATIAIFIRRSPVTPKIMRIAAGSPSTAVLSMSLAFFFGWPHVTEGAP